MSNDNRYNGWTNYETWNVALWLDNDGANFWEERAQECYNDAQATVNFTREEEATFALSKEIKSEIEENTPTVTGMYADLLNASISAVNWHEIAEHYVDEVEKEEPEEEEENESKPSL
jgi:hypothetical protein